MSFAYLALYTGDYLRDTRHLTPLRHGVYFLLLMHCWDSRGPVPLDEQECAGIANCRSADEIDALRYILTKYFVRMDDGWYNSRMQREIERAQSISAARSNAGFKGYQAKAKQLPSKRQASASTPPPPLTTTTTTTTNAVTNTNKGKVKNTTHPAGAFVRPDDCPEQAWDDWLKARKVKRLPNTSTAWAGFLREVGKAGTTPALAIQTCAERGWAGFKAEWESSASTSKTSGNREALNTFAAKIRAEHEKDITP
jgi:uncharacterized protein YdaU (DUF1376 family)